jgi:hypothetical protein
LVGEKLVVKKTPSTYLGNAQLHKQHKVMIEGGSVPRAKVMDQHLIDLYLMRGVLDLKQHSAGEYILGQAARAKLWPTGADLLGANIGGDRRGGHVPFGVFPFGRTLVTVKQARSPYHAYVVQRVICDEWDVRENDHAMGCLKSGLDVIAAIRMGWHRNPLWHIKEAARLRTKRPVAATA